MSSRMARSALIEVVDRTLGHELMARGSRVLLGTGFSRFQWSGQVMCRTVEHPIKSIVTHLTITSTSLECHLLWDVPPL